MTRFTTSLLVLMFVPVHLSGQGIRVAVDVSERTSGLFESRISSALRSLGDVVIVDRAQRPHFRFSVVVLCLPNEECGDATSYSVSFRMSRPVSQGDLVFALSGADSTIVSSLDAAALDRAVALLDAEIPITALAASWGRNVYQREVDELIAEIDVNCFNRHRLMDRMVASAVAGNVAERRALVEQLNARDDWLC